jgi:hypothetical protein
MDSFVQKLHCISCGFEIGLNDNINAEMRVLSKEEIRIEEDGQKLK